MSLRDWMKSDAAKPYRFQPPAPDPDKNYKDAAKAEQAERIFETVANMGAGGGLLRFPRVATWEERKARAEKEAKLAKEAEESLALGKASLKEISQLRAQQQETAKEIEQLEAKARVENINTRARARAERKGRPEKRKDRVWAIKQLNAEDKVRSG